MRMTVHVLRREKRAERCRGVGRGCMRWRGGGGGVLLRWGHGHGQGLKMERLGGELALDWVGVGLLAASRAKTLRLAENKCAGSS